MATFTASGIELTDSERAALAQPLEKSIRAWAADRSPDVNSLKLRPARARLITKRGDQKQFVRGPFAGTEAPPFDETQVMTWAQGNVIVDPFATSSPHGGLNLQMFTGFGPQIEAISYAAIMFWAIPSSSGSLTFMVDQRQNPEMYRLVHGVTLNQATSQATFTLFAGTQQVQLSPFGLVGAMQIDQTNLDGEFVIGSNGNFSFDEAHNGTNPSVAAQTLIGGAGSAQPPLVVACWLWLAGHVRTTGNAGAQLAVSYAFDGITVNVP